jgi:DNA-binding transcriptional ArsR family regulator
MDVEVTADFVIARVAGAIGEPARARMLYCLLSGQARTSTELGIVADVSPSTASAHLTRLKDVRLVKMVAQGKHRYYTLQGASVATALEALLNVASATGTAFVARASPRLRAARTCYDHMAGRVAVALHDHFWQLAWFTTAPVSDTQYELTPVGAKALSALSIDVDTLHSVRRKFAYACLDWSERRPHIGGALGAAILKLALTRRWVVQDLDSRALRVTAAGSREMARRFGVQPQ